MGSKDIKSITFTLVSAAFIAAVALAAILIWTDIGERQPNRAALTRPNPSPSTRSWVDVSSWQSSGNDDSPPFHISANTWRVVWVAPHDQRGDGSFAVDIYNPHGLFLLTLYDTADSPGVKFDGPLRGTLGLPGPGDFFLRIKTARDYQVSVQEDRQ